MAWLRKRHHDRQIACRACRPRVIPEDWSAPLGQGAPTMAHEEAIEAYIRQSLGQEIKRGLRLPGGEQPRRQPTPRPRARCSVNDFITKRPVTNFGSRVTDL